MPLENIRAWEHFKNKYRELIVDFPNLPRWLFVLPAFRVPCRRRPAAAS
jgi:hypothetical protein